MPIITDKINKLEADPRFASLSYEDQITMRSALMRKYLPVTPEFIGLDNNTKQGVYEQILYRAPVFERNLPTYQQAIPLIKQRKDPQFLKGVLETVFPEIRTAMQNDPIQKKEHEGLQALRYAYALNFLHKHAGVSQLSRATRKIAKGIWKGLAGIQGLDVQETGERFEAIFNDTDKLIQYMDYNMNKDSKLRRMLPSINILSNITGMGIDLVAGYNLTTGAATKIIKDMTGGVGISQAVLQSITPGKATWLQKVIASKAFATAAPPIAHGISDGLIGMTREMVREAWDGSLTDLSTQRRLMKGLKYFTEYAVGDILFFTAGRLLKNLGQTAFRYVRGFKPDVKKAVEVTEALQKIMRMEDLDPAWFARQDDVTKEVIRQTQACMITFSNVERLSPEAGFKVYAGSQGFLALPGKGDTWRMVGILDDKLKYTAPSMNKAVNWMEKQIKYIEMFNPGSTPRFVSTATKNIQVEGTLKVKLPKAPESTLKVLTDSIAPIGGKFTTEGVETFTKGMLSSGGADDDVIKGIKSVIDGDTLKLTVSGNTIELPAYVGNPEKEYQVVRNLINDLNQYIPKEGQVKDAISIYKKQVFAKDLYTAGWVDDFLKQRGSVLTNLPDGSVQTTFQGKVLIGDDYNDIADQIMKGFATNDPGLVAKYLMNYEGIKLTGDIDKGFVIKKGRKHLGTYGTLDEMFMARPDLVPRIPSQYGPKLTLIDNAKEMIYHQGVLMGSTDDVLSELSKFKDISNSARPFKFKGANVQPAGSEFRVTVDNLGYSETFKSVKDINMFLKKGLYEKLEYIAPRKGFIMSTYKGQIHLTTSGGRTYVANTPDEAAVILSKKGLMPEWAPELTGIDAQLVNSMEKVPGFRYKPEVNIPEVESKQMSSFDIFQGFYRGPDNYFAKLAKKNVTGAKEVLKQFRRVEDVRDVIIGMTQKIAPLIDDVFRYPNGTPVSVKDLKQVTKMMELDPSEWGRFITDNKLKTELIDIGNNLRTFYGRHADDGLFLYMGNDPTTWLKDYMPKLRLHMQKSGKVYNSNNLRELLQDCFGNNVPQGMEAFFKYARIEDIYSLTREMNAKTLLQKYVMVGHRNKFMGPLIEDINKWIMTNGGNVDKALRKQFMAYLGDVAGIPSSLNTKLIEDMTQRMFLKLKIGDKLIARNFTEAIMGTSYLATMGWRAWLPIRNSLQILTTLAPRLGNTWISKALSILNKDKTGRIYNLLRERGMLTMGLPVGGSQLFEEGTKVGKLLKSGMHWYKNSDSFTRAVAYVTATSRFDDALLRLKKGLINNKQFIQHSGLFNMEPGRLSQALGLIDQGLPNAAKDLFARDMIMETMFPYRSGTSPLAFRGTIGKIFGQFGHYPVYWVENIRRGLGRGTLTNKLAYAARFLGNTTAIAGSLATIGINSDSFLFYTPVLFTGGPWYDFINQGLNLWGKGYEGRQARAKLLGIKSKGGKIYWDSKVGVNYVKKMIPGGLFLDKLVTDAAEALNRGDYYRFIMALGSVPMKPY